MLPRFQSTHPRGVRLSGIADLNGNVSISIHAPTRGATFGLSFLSSSTSISIHAPTRGATSHTHSKEEKAWTFQSTHPRGVRRVAIYIQGCLYYFNPRTHEGCDCKNIQKYFLLLKYAYALCIFLNLYVFIFKVILYINAKNSGAKPSNYLCKHTVRT